MSDELEISIAEAVQALRTEGFELEYVNAAVNAYRGNLQLELEKAAERGIRLAVSPLSKVTSVTSVDDPDPKESIGWQYRALKPGDPAPGGWVIVDE